MEIGRSFRIMAALLGLAAFAGTASAEPITYTITLNQMAIDVAGETFGDTSITFKLVADTDDIQADQGAYSFFGGATFAIPDGPSGGAGAFQLSLFSPMGQLTLQSENFEFTAYSPALVGYDLASAIVVESPEVRLTPGFVNTPYGFMSLSPAGSSPVTLGFTTSLGAVAVPEPSSLAMAGLGSLTLAGATIRRRRGSAGATAG